MSCSRAPCRQTLYPKPTFSARNSHPRNQPLLHVSIHEIQQTQTLRVAGKGENCSCKEETELVGDKNRALVACAVGFSGFASATMLSRQIEWCRISHLWLNSAPPANKFPAILRCAERERELERVCSSSISQTQWFYFFLLIEGLILNEATQQMLSLSPFSILEIINLIFSKLKFCGVINLRREWILLHLVLSIGHWSNTKHFLSRVISILSKIIIT